MKSPMKNSMKILLIGFFLLLLSCATTGKLQQYTQGSIIDMGHYCVTGPPGDGWFVNIQKDKGFVGFEKRNVSGTGLINDRWIIRVFRNLIQDEKFWRLSEEEVANDYRNGEEADMIRRGVRTGQYELSDVKKDITMIGDKKVYFMSYKTLRWSKVEEFTDRSSVLYRVVGEAVLYLFFPADFKEKHFFYMFLINHTYLEGYLRKGDLTAIIPVINSLQIK